MFECRAARQPTHQGKPMHLGAAALDAAPPRRGAASTSQGRPHSIFKRVLQRRNVVVALAAARELPHLTLSDALELTLLVARKDPRRHRRVAAHWLLRYLEDDPQATVEEAALAD